MRIRRFLAVLVAVAAWSGPNVAGAAECDLYTGTNSEAHGLVVVTAYRVGVFGAGNCYTSRTRAEPPLTCVVDGQIFGELAAPAVLAGVGTSSPFESGDFCEAHGRTAVTLTDCTVWAVNARFFRSGALVGSTLNNAERACAP